MPTTPAGTAYTVYVTTLPVHGECYWAVADAHVPDADIPTILYTHGSEGAANQFATISAWSGLRNWLIDNGWAWIEGLGGGPKSWGSDAAQAAYLAYLDHVSGVLSVGDVVLLGRSMGGLVSAWLYAQSGRDFAGWINNSGVSTMFVGGIQDSAAGYWATSMRQAYGLANQGSAEANYAILESTQQARAPETWPVSVWSGKNILCCYGDADTTVPWMTRGAGPLRSIWSGQPATDLTSVRIGGDHSSTNGSYLDVATMTNFLLAVTGSVVTPSPETYMRVVGSYLYHVGSRIPYTIKMNP